MLGRRRAGPSGARARPPSQGSRNAAPKVRLARDAAPCDAPGHSLRGMGYGRSVRAASVRRARHRGRTYFLYLSRAALPSSLSRRAMRRHSRRPLAERIPPRRGGLRFGHRRGRGTVRRGCHTQAELVPSVTSRRFGNPREDSDGGAPRGSGGAFALPSARRPAPGPDDASHQSDKSDASDRSDGSDERGGAIPSAGTTRRRGALSVAPASSWQAWRHRAAAIGGKMPPVLPPGWRQSR